MIETIRRWITTLRPTERILIFSSGPAIVVGTLAFFLRDLWVVLYALVIAALVLGLIAAINASLRFRTRRRGEQMSESIIEDIKLAKEELAGVFETALKEIKSRGLHIQTDPWLFFLGESQAGKTFTIKKASLNEEIGPVGIEGAGGTRDCRFWFTSKAVILDTAGRLTVDSEGMVDPEQWNEMLRLLVRYRPDCPINGVLVGIPCTSLIFDDTAKREEKAERIRSRLMDLQSVLKIRMPIFFVILKTDFVAGFQPFFRNLKAFQRNHLMGWSNPAPFNKPFENSQFDEAFESVCGDLHRWRHKFLNSKSSLSRSDEYYYFVDEFRTLKEPINDYLKKIFSDSSYGQPGFFRGFFFTSSIQEGKDVSQAFKSLLPDLDERNLVLTRSLSETPYFVRDLYTEKVFPETGLVLRTDRSRLLNSFMKLGSYSCGAILTIGGLIALILGVVVVRSTLDEVNDSVEKIADTQKNRTPLRNNILTLGEEAPTVHLQERLTKWDSYRPGFLRRMMSFFYPIPQKDEHLVSKLKTSYRAHYEGEDLSVVRKALHDQLSRMSSPNSFGTMEELQLGQKTIRTALKLHAQRESEDPREVFELFKKLVSTLPPQLLASSIPSTNPPSKPTDVAEAASVRGNRAGLSPGYLPLSGNGATTSPAPSKHREILTNQFLFYLVFGGSADKVFSPQQNLTQALDQIHDHHLRLVDLQPFHRRIAGEPLEKWRALHREVKTMKGRYTTLLASQTREKFSSSAASFLASWAEIKKWTDDADGQSLDSAMSELENIETFYTTLAAIPNLELLSQEDLRTKKEQYKQAFQSFQETFRSEFDEPDFPIVDLARTAPSSQDNTIVDFVRSAKERLEENTLFQDFPATGEFTNRIEEKLRLDSELCSRPTSGSTSSWSVSDSRNMVQRLIREVRTPLYRDAVLTHLNELRRTPIESFAHFRAGSNCTVPQDTPLNWDTLHDCKTLEAITAHFNAIRVAFALDQGAEKNRSTGTPSLPIETNEIESELSSAYSNYIKEYAGYWESLLGNLRLFKDKADWESFRTDLPSLSIDSLLEHATRELSPLSDLKDTGDWPRVTQGLLYVNGGAKKKGLQRLVGKFSAFVGPLSDDGPAALGAAREAKARSNPPPSLWLAEALTQRGSTFDEDDPFVAALRDLGVRSRAALVAACQEEFDDNWKSLRNLQLDQAPFCTGDEIDATSWSSDEARFIPYDKNHSPTKELQSLSLKGLFRSGGLIRNALQLRQQCFSTENGDLLSIEISEARNGFLDRCHSFAEFFWEFSGTTLRDKPIEYELSVNVVPPDFKDAHTSVYHAYPRAHLGFNETSDEKLPEDYFQFGTPSAASWKLSGNDTGVIFSAFKNKEMHNSRFPETINANGYLGFYLLLHQYGKRASKSEDPERWFVSKAFPIKEIATRVDKTLQKDKPVLLHFHVEFAEGVTVPELIGPLPE